MKKLIILIAIVSTWLPGYSQKFELAEVSDHYMTLQQKSSEPNPARSFMDTIKYPATEYGSSIVYLLVKPCYLSDTQVKTLTESVSFPINSSDQVKRSLTIMLDLQEKRTPEQVQRV